MNPNSVIAVLSSLQKIWEAESQKKFQEEIIKIIHSLVEQMNMINANQMKEMSDILTRFEMIQLRFEMIQYWLITTLVVIVIIFSYSYILLLRRVKFLELHQK